MTWFVQHIQPITNSIGLIFDIIGAILVAIEVVNKFEGKQFKDMPMYYGESPPPEKTEQYEQWERNKFFYMSLGLCLLLIGFLLQILSNWLPIWLKPL